MSLSPEREALWARLEKASFLTDGEKRAAVGYGGKGAGGTPLARKYREDQARDDQGRWVDEGGDGGDEPDGEGGSESRPGVADPPAVLAQAEPNRAQADPISAETYADAFNKALTQLGTATGYGAATSDPVSNNSPNGFTTQGTVFLSGPRGRYSITADPGWGLEVSANRDANGNITGFTVTPVPGGF